MVYTANWGNICYLPLFRETRNNHWSYGLDHIGVSMCVSKLRFQRQTKTPLQWFWSNLVSECFSLMNISYLRCIPVVTHRPNNTVNLQWDSPYDFPFSIVYGFGGTPKSYPLWPEKFETSLSEMWICPKVQSIAVGNGFQTLDTLRFRSRNLVNI